MIMFLDLSSCLFKEASCYSSCFLRFLHALVFSHLKQLALMMQMKIVDMANNFSSQVTGIDDAYEDCWHDKQKSYKV